MHIFNSAHRSISPRQVAVAAEAITAAQFSLFEFDILQQAGHARFVYDLVVAKSGGMMKISVFGSMTGFWNFVDSYVKKAPAEKADKADYHRAIDLWLADHRSGTCCLVQFESTELDRMPRLYLASAQEIAVRLHRSTEHVGSPALHEVYDEAGEWRTSDSLPASWGFSEARVKELLETPTESRPIAVHSAPAFAPSAAEEPVVGVQRLPLMA